MDILMCPSVWSGLLLFGISDYFAWFTSFCNLHQAQFRVSSPVSQWLSNYFNKYQRFRATVHSWNMVPFTPQMQEVSRCHLQNRFKHIGVTFTSDEQLESQMSGVVWWGISQNASIIRKPRQKAKLFITLYFFWHFHSEIVTEWSTFQPQPQLKSHKNLMLVVKVVTAAT